MQHVIATHSYLTLKTYLKKKKNMQVKTYLIKLILSLQKSLEL